jgi:hypothetical protein
MVELIVGFSGNASAHISSVTDLPTQPAILYFLEYFSITADRFVAQADSDAVYPPPARQCCRR